MLGSVLPAPFTLSPGSVGDLSGSTGTVDSTKRIDEMDPFAGAVYYMGDIYCDQLSSRSYYLNGNQMPFSARVVGIFGGLPTGSTIAIALRPKISPLVLLGIMPMPADRTLQLTTSYEPLNRLRMLTGPVAGACIALFLSSMIDGRGGKKVRNEGGRHPPRR